MFSFFQKYTNTKNNTIDNTEKDNIICKLCHDDIDIKSKDFYSPCLCSGSIGLIHKNCFLELIQAEETCSVCLASYPPTTIFREPVFNPQPDLEQILTGVCSKLNTILTEMDGYTQIKKIYKLFASNTDFYESIIETVLKIDNVSTYGLTLDSSKNYIQSGGYINTNTNELDDIDNIDIDNINDINDINDIGNTDNTDNTEINNISKDIVEALDKINTIIYNACDYNDLNIQKYHIESANLTITNFTKELNQYYTDICYHSLNYLAKNPIHFGTLYGCNMLYSYISLWIRIRDTICPSQINNLFGLGMIQSLPISLQSKMILNKQISKNMNSGDITSASYIENSFIKLNNKYINIIGCGLNIINYTILMSVCYGTYYIGSCFLNSFY